MSGPKTSRYRMTPEQLKRLQEELEKRRREQIRREKRRQEREKLSRELAEIKELLAEIVDCTDELRKISDETIVTLKSIEVLLYSENIEDIQNGIQRIRSKKEKIYDMMLAYVREKKEMKQQRLFEENKILAEGFVVSFERIYVDEGNEKSKYEDLIFEKMKRISLQNLPANLREQWGILKERAKTITDAKFLENFYNISIVPYVKECQKYLELYEKQGSRYENLLREYKTLLIEMGREEKEESFSLENLEALEHLVDEMKQQILRSSEEEYISKSIDEAMEEMGYLLVGEREFVKKSGKKFRNELYHFSEGTAVNVTYANNGQITMELGAVDNQDRMPTDKESEKLMEDMTKFCDEYSVLEKILKEKGIIRKNIQILPPHVEYAQVINTTKYDLYKELEKFHVQKRSKNEEKESYME